MIVLPPLGPNQVVVSTVTVAAIEEVAVETVAQDADRADPAEDPVAADVSKEAANPVKVNCRFYSPVTPYE